MIVITKTNGKKIKIDFKERAYDLEYNLLQQIQDKINKGVSCVLIKDKLIVTREISDIQLKCKIRSK